MHSDYVPLHLHTEYSLLDGAIRINDLIEKAIEYRLPAIAMTDHGNLFGAVDFYGRVSKAGLKPIIGCEVYIAPGSRFDKGGPSSSAEKSFHLILLAKDINGFRNLSRLVSSAFLEGFYYKPRIDKDLLEQYSGGLIGLSSCLKGEIPRYLAAGLIDRARQAALEYRRIFGADNFYLEIQANELPEQEEVNRQIIELSRDLHIPLVATNDCHYLNREDSRAHEILLCIQTGKTLQDTSRMRFSKDTFYFKSPEEMKEAFRDIPEAVENTRKVAEKCNLDFKFNEIRLPRFAVPDGESASEYLKRLAENGLADKLDGAIPEEYSSRLSRELDMIATMGFSSYFLIVRDFIHFAKGKKIPVGPGRGSAAGSLVAYSLDITDIDPVKYGLLFERFLNPERVSMPDIDVDFCMDRRAEVIDYVTRRYGKDYVAQIITFGTMQARAAIRDVGRVMNIPYAEVDRVAKLIPAVPKIALQAALKMEPKLNELYESNSGIHELIDVAQRLEGISRHASTHAAGIVISPEPLTDFMPLYKASNDEAIVTQCDMDAIKKLGLLKFDFLGLKTLTVIDKAEKLINTGRRDRGGPEFSVKDIPLDDEKTFSLLCNARTAGVFQLESSGMKDLVKRLRPDSFESVIALVALFRPGPLGSGMVDEFIAGKNASALDGGEKPEGSLTKLRLPQLDEILKETHGIILYQEQVMEIAHTMANFTLGQADILRKAMGGKNPEEMERMKNIFIEGLKSNRVPQSTAETLYSLILKFAQYGFNKSHSAAYALISYQTAYLKAHYPVEFMAASLSADMDNTAKVVVFINECRDMGIEILPPDINQSTREFQVAGNSIRFGLEAVKGVGGSAIDAILESRGRTPFESFFDLCARVDSRKVNRKVIESLIKSGALDAMGRRAQLMEALPSVMEAAMRHQKEKESGQESMFGMHQPKPEQILPAIEEWNESKLLLMEKEALGFYITGHPLNKYRDLMTELAVTPTHELQDLEDRQEVNICGLIRASRQIQTKRTGDLMAYITLEDMYGAVEIIVFPDAYKTLQESMSNAEGDPVIISGYTDRTDKGMKIIAQKIVPIHQRNDVRKPRKNSRHHNGSSEKGKRPSGGSAPPLKQYRSLLLTVNKDKTPETLLKLDTIFSKYSGDCPVYLRIVSPRKWETVLSTDRQILPSEEMIIEIENLLGSEGVLLNGPFGAHTVQNASSRFNDR